jgi:hypothetical protein
MITFSKAIGANTDLVTAQAFVYPKVKDGETVGLAVLISAEGDDVFVKVRQLGSLLQDNFFSEESLDQPVVQKIHNLESFIKTELGDVLNLEVLLAFFQNELLYLKTTGRHQAYLKRSGNISGITQNQPSDVISGYLEPNDKVLLLASENKTAEVVGDLLNTEVEDGDALENEMEIITRLEPSPLPKAAVLIENPIESKDPFTKALEDKKTQEQIAPLLIRIPRRIKLPNFSFLLSFFNNKIFPRPTRFLIFFGVFILVAAILGGLIFIRAGNSKKDEQVKTFLILAEDKFNNAQKLKDQDPKVAQLSLVDAGKEVDAALNLDPKNQKALDLKKQIDSKAEDILKIYTVSDWQLFLSLDLIKTGFQPSKLDKSLDNLLLLDEAQKTVVALNLEKRTPQILGGSYQFGQMMHAGINGQKVFVFSPDKGVSMIEMDSNEQALSSGDRISQIVKPDPEWGQISALFAFAGNVYLLDSGKNQIWKYMPGGVTFSERYEYLNGNSGLDFSGAKKMQIDYSVWVLKTGPEIIRFTGGDKDFFAVSGLDKPLNELTSFFVSDTTEFSYFLDPENSRMVVLDKKGEYFAQYLGDKFKSAKDLVVDEEGKKVYLLEGNKIYSVQLR